MVKRLSDNDIYQTLAHGAHTGNWRRIYIYCDDMLNVVAKVRK